MTVTHDNRKKPQAENGNMTLLTDSEEKERASAVRELMHQMGGQSENRRVVYTSYPACNSDD